MNCGRCGTGLPDNAAICPTCGTINPAAWPGGGGQQSTNYGQYQPRGYDGPPPQQQQEFDDPELLGCCGTQHSG